MMHPEAIRSIIKQAKAAWIAKDVEALVALFTDHGELIVPGHYWQGHQEIRQGLEQFAQDDLAIQIEIKRILIAGNQAIVEWTWKQTNPQTGEQSRAEDAIVIDFQAKKISRWREYIDPKTPQEG